MKLLNDLNQFLFNPVREFFIEHLRFSPVGALQLRLFGIALGFLLLLMLASDSYLVNFLAALLLVPFSCFIEAVQISTKSPQFKSQLLLLIVESFIYIGALLHNINSNDVVFVFLGAFSILGLWLQDYLNTNNQMQISFLPFEPRMLLLALTTLLTLNFIYFLIFLTVVFGQIAIHIKSLSQK